MLAYILKRLLLMIPTLLGVLLLPFMVIQFVPGGPVEPCLAVARAWAGGGSAEGGAWRTGAQGVDAQRLEEIKKLYGFDKAPHERFVRMQRVATPSAKFMRGIGLMSMSNKRGQL